jgi:hypothetical protein
MIKEGESFVHFKLRVKEEIKDLELNNPELVDEYKKELVIFVHDSTVMQLLMGKESPLNLTMNQARDYVRTIIPDYYNGKSNEEIETEISESTKSATVAIAVFLLFMFAIGGFLVFKLFEGVGMVLGL